jgi:hypothetical protein
MAKAKKQSAYDYKTNRAKPRTGYVAPQVEGPISQDPKIQRGMAQTDRTLAQWESENDRRDRELVNQQFTVPQFHGKMYADPIDDATQSRLDAMDQPVSNGAAEFDYDSPRMRNLRRAQSREGSRAPKVPVSQQTAPPLLPLPNYAQAQPQRPRPQSWNMESVQSNPDGSPPSIFKGIKAMNEFFAGRSAQPQPQPQPQAQVAPQPMAEPVAAAPAANYTSAGNIERAARLRARGMDDTAIERMIYPERFADLRAAAQQQVSQRGLVMGRPRPNRQVASN